MCHDRIEAGSPRFLPRPRWKALYGLAVLSAASLATVELLNAAGVVRTALRCGIVVATAVAIAFWVNHNRIALDAEDWCACAGARMTVRVVASAAPPVPAATLGVSDGSRVPRSGGRAVRTRLGVRRPL
jgi:hypothetical protein